MKWIDLPDFLKLNTTIKVCGTNEEQLNVSMVQNEVSEKNYRQENQQVRK